MASAATNPHRMSWTDGMLSVYRPQVSQASGVSLGKSISVVSRRWVQYKATGLSQIDTICGRFLMPFHDCKSSSCSFYHPCCLLLLCHIATTTSNFNSSSSMPLLPFSSSSSTAYQHLQTFEFTGSLSLTAQSHVCK